MPRPIRPREIALLQSLLAGPGPIKQGPVGACLRKGWIRDIANAPAPTRLDGLVTPVFVLTPAGRAILDEAGVGEVALGEAGAGGASEATRKGEAAADEQHR
jgi:hypothetical protein